MKIIERRLSNFGILKNREISSSNDSSQLACNLGAEYL